ncbi:hypothetical protein DY000_02062187 [Brassica cretica]|uniref:Uncharacterized protein n=1 Tax=Brassica cretica TaxID=69181 RepID=A0ABQ7AQP0_BRACR|nr:hypothetical protein DY000_02062187 [Brassica cretica]
MEERGDFIFVLAAAYRSRDSPCSCGRRESCYPGMTTSCRSSPGELLGDMAGGVANDPFTAYQEAAKVMSTQKGSSSRSASGDEVMVTRSRRSTVVKLEPSPSLPGKKPKSGGMTTRSAQQSADMARSVGSLATALSDQKLNVFPQDGIVLPKGDPSEVVQVLQGGLLRTVSQLYHLGERLSNEGLLILREEIEDLKRQVAESSSADALATSQKNQELEEAIDALKAAAETFKFEMVMAVNGARAVIQEGARNKGVPLPTFEDEPAIPPVSEMDVDSSVKPRGSPA